MKQAPDWRRSNEAKRLEAVGRLLRAQFDQIAKAPAPPVLVELADRLEAKANQSTTDGDGVPNGQSPPKASDA